MISHEGLGSPLIKQNLTKGLGIAVCCLFDLKERNI